MLLERSLSAQKSCTMWMASSRARLWSQVRTEIVKFLESKGLFRGTRPNPMVLGVCSRSGDVIEPLMRPQWCVSHNALCHRLAMSM